MPTIVGVLTFMSRINFIHSWVEYENKFYNLEACSIYVILTQSTSSVNFKSTMHRTQFLPRKPDKDVIKAF